jgi:hypothetical protein
VAVGAPDVEKVTVTVDRRGDRAAQPLPTVGIATEATAPARVSGREVPRLQFALWVIHGERVEDQPAAASAVDT